MTQNDYFKTNDLALSAALVCVGLTLDSIEKSNDKAIFIFKRTDGLDEAVQAYWANELTLNPKFFFNCLKEVKSRLYAQE